MTLAASLVAQAQGILLDDGTRWSSSDLLAYLNEGQTLAVSLKPDCGAVVEDLTLVAGVNQSLPAGGLVLFDVPQNVSGGAITEMPKAVLDGVFPGWTASTASATVQHYVYDPSRPTQFKVFPPQPATPGQVVIEYAKVPTACTMNGVDGETTDTAIGLTDDYAPALVNYMLFRALSRLSKGADPNKAAGYYQAFLTALGLKDQAEMAHEPKGGDHGAGN